MIDHLWSVWVMVVCVELGCWDLLMDLLQPVVPDDLDCLEVAMDLKVV